MFANLQQQPTWCPWQDEAGMSSMSPTAEVSEEPKRNRRVTILNGLVVNGKFTKKKHGFDNFSYGFFR